MGEKPFHNNTYAFLYGNAAARQLHGKICEVFLFAGNNDGHIVSDNLSHRGILTEIANIYFKGGVRGAVEI